MRRSFAAIAGDQAAVPVCYLVSASHHTTGGGLIRGVIHVIPHDRRAAVSPAASPAVASLAEPFPRGFFACLCRSFFSLLLAGSPAHGAQLQEGQSGNRYLAGSQVIIDAPVPGDLLAAGGEVAVRQSIGADAALAGGTVTVSADIAQDLRVAGGKVTVENSVGGELFAAGGTVKVGASAAIAGPVIIGGGDIGFAGRAAQGIKLTGNTIHIAGQIDGNARLYGRQITITPGARINGDLIYASANELPRDQLAAVSGKVVREATPEAWESASRPAPDRAWFHPAFFLSMLATGVLLLWLFPHAVQDASNAVRQSPGLSLLAGVALLLALPPAAVLLMMTLIGLPLGLGLFFLYPLLLLLSYLLLAVLVAQRIAQAAGRAFEYGLLRQTGFLALALLLLTLLMLIPFAGLLLVILGMLAGAGGLVMAMVRRYQGDARAGGRAV